MRAVRDPDYAGKVHRSFARQAFMGLIGAELVRIEPGFVEIVLPLRPALSQQHGFAHAGAAWSIADSAGGYAAQTLMAAEDGVMTVELKINLLSPAKGERLVARGRVERAGRRLTVCRSDVVAVDAAGQETAVALAIGTFMCMEGLDRDG